MKQRRLMLVRYLETHLLVERPETWDFESVQMELQHALRHYMQINRLFMNSTGTLPGVICFWRYVHDAFYTLERPQVLRRLGPAFLYCMNTES